MGYADLYTSEAPRISTGDRSSPLYVLGVPFDQTTSYRPGSRFGPDSIRQAYWNIEIYDYKLMADAERIKVYDAGNMAPISDAGAMLERVKRVVSEFAEMGKSVGLIGGEHLISLASVQAISEKHNVTLVVFDAHLDLRDSLYGLKVSHATWLRRLLESRKLKVVHVGAHAYVEEELEAASSFGVKVINRDEAPGVNLSKLVSGDVYVSIDTDVLDPSCAPGVANPEPEGLSYSQLFDLLRSLRGSKVRWFDVVEVNPLLDHSGITSIAAAKAFSILSILSVMNGA